MRPYNKVRNNIRPVIRILLSLGVITFLVFTGIMTYQVMFSLPGYELLTLADWGLAYACFFIFIALTLDALVHMGIILMECLSDYDEFPARPVMNFLAMDVLAGFAGIVLVYLLGVWIRGQPQDTVLYWASYAVILALMIVTALALLILKTHPDSKLLSRMM